MATLRHVIELVHFWFSMLDSISCFFLFLLCLLFLFIRFVPFVAHSSIVVRISFASLRVCPPFVCVLSHETFLNCKLLEYYYFFNFNDNLTVFSGLPSPHLAAPDSFSCCVVVRPCFEDFGDTTPRLVLAWMASVLWIHLWRSQLETSSSDRRTSAPPPRPIYYIQVYYDEFTKVWLFGV